MEESLRTTHERRVTWNVDGLIIETFDPILRNDPKFDALIWQNEERQAAMEIMTFFRYITDSRRRIILTVDPTTVNKEAIGSFRSIADIYL